MQEKDVIDTFEQYVKSIYNFDLELKPQQITILTALLNGHNVMVVLPTGFGKSMCFILPPLIRDELDWTVQHMCLVISPLTALMADQVQSLGRHGVKAIAIDKDTETLDVQDAISGKYSVVFMSPERAISTFWRRAFLSDSFRKSICLLALDECHCLTEWGGDFRPKYRDVCALRSIIECPVICLTATADKNIKEDVMKTMCMEADNTTVLSIPPDRPNIFLSFKHSKQRLVEDLSWVVDKLLEKRIHCPKLIIYCRSTSDVSSVYEFIRDGLHEGGIEEEDEKKFVEQFHVSLDSETRNAILCRFKAENNSLRVLVATVAFGLGMQIPDIQVIVHWGVPKSVMTYWQEVGRGGRDGRCAIAITYVYGRSMDVRRTTKDMREIAKKGVNMGDCIRKNILSQFQLADDDVFREPSSCVLQSCGSDCRCEQCWCCAPCMNKCPCSADVDVEKRYY